MNKKIFNSFVEAINKQNVEEICSLMSEDHLFVDSYGNEAVGKALMKEGWLSYFRLFPDYKVEITDILTNGDMVAAFGFASGTYKGLESNNGNHWRLPASWRAIICDGKIQLWQVYADSKIPFDIIARNN